MTTVTSGEDVEIFGVIDFGRRFSVKAPMVKNGRVLSSVKFTYEIYVKSVQNHEKGIWHNMFFLPGIKPACKYITNTTSQNIELLRDYHEKIHTPRPIPIIDFERRKRYDDYIIDYNVKTDLVDDASKQTFVTEFSFDNLYFQQTTIRLHFQIGFLTELFTFIDEKHKPELIKMHIECCYEKDIYEPDLDLLIEKIVSYIKVSEKISGNIIDSNVADFVMDMDPVAFEYVNQKVKENFSDLDVATVLNREFDKLTFSRLPKAYIDKFPDAVL